MEGSFSTGQNQQWAVVTVEEEEEEEEEEEYIYCAVLNASHWSIRPPILRSLSLMAVYIPSLQVLRGRPHFYLPSGFQLIVT
jgi:hypothetical protein